MIYAAILAGGIGRRMQRSGLPKQFIPLGGKPIIVHTVEQFAVHPRIEAVLVAVPEDWVSYTRDLCEEARLADGKVQVVSGGADRNASLAACANGIRERFGIGAEDIVLSHDAVRPFVSQRIIDDNIAAGLETGAADTVIPAVDTIVASEDGAFVSGIPARSTMFQGQTPQTFNVAALLEVYASLTAGEKALLTDACKMFALRGRPVKLVRGELFNLKITTVFDYEVAQVLLKRDRL
jgi:2-C-methyl-D-erythritol 4-phosphate cytidylyltransferase